MPLVKVFDGLLEEDAFYLTSPVGDFLGGGSWSRTENTFTVNSGCVKRRIPYSGFVIDVKKNSSAGITDGSLAFFIGDEQGESGLYEKLDEERQSIAWRLVYYDGFIQMYCMYGDGRWENAGGTHLELAGELLQGFCVKGGAKLTLTDFRIYASPYLVLQNFPPHSIVKLYDKDSNLIKERVFNAEYECPIFMDWELNGYVEVWDNSGLLFTSDTVVFRPGDVFLFTKDNIRLLYQNKVLNYEATELSRLNELFTIQNVGDEAVYSIYVEVVNNNSDCIEISFDGELYDTRLYIEKLMPGEERDLYININKDSNTGQFCVKKFDIRIY